ncbi:MAG: DNA-binding protein [Lentisphaerae bacterium GWF2_52_8]|nr:MAG: DNA-binding protein [Lentisphaerae bacterium GWF2_52_8]
MKYSEARNGRVFVVRLEDGDILHEEIERLAAKEKIAAASVVVVGGIDKGSKLIVGPRHSRAKEVCPMEHVIEDACEVCGTGTIFPDEAGKPILHLHIACGRETDTITGCVRSGVKIWHVLEVIVQELTGSTASRRFEESTGFKLLQP